MAAFAFNVKLLHAHPNASFDYVHTEAQEGYILTQLGFRTAFDLEPKANGCSEILPLKSGPASFWCHRERRRWTATGINGHLMNLRLHLRGTKFVLFVNAYASTMINHDVVKNKVYCDLHIPSPSDSTTDEQTGCSRQLQSPPLNWPYCLVGVLGAHGIGVCCNTIGFHLIQT
nr:unnamed protein product [Spirometra erinaceieuropaei]